MAAAAALPEEFRVLEEDFVDCKMAINNRVNEILSGGGARPGAGSRPRSFG